MKDYRTNTFYSDEDGGYIADISDLDACSAFGDTTEKALAEVEIAKAAWLKQRPGAKADSKTTLPTSHLPRRSLKVTRRCQKHSFPRGLR